MQARKRDLTTYRAHIKCRAYDTASACPYLAALIPALGTLNYTCMFVTLPKRKRRLPNSLGRACADPYDDTSQTRPPRQKHKAAS